jgi:hypothetical protein
LRISNANSCSALVIPKAIERGGVLINSPVLNCTVRMRVSESGQRILKKKDFRLAVISSAFLINPLVERRMLRRADFLAVDVVLSAFFSSISVVNYPPEIIKALAYLGYQLLKDAAAGTLLE